VILECRRGLDAELAIAALTEALARLKAEPADAEAA
jgi:hypothetical protein